MDKYQYSNIQKISENTIEYFIYKYVDGPDKKLALEYLASEYLAFLGKDLVEHIWQNDVFNLKTYSNEKEYYLHGQVNFSDNINDEFFVIFLLRELSSYDPDIIIRIHDEDGEILLIETAEYLDKWAQNPQKAEGKVFLYQGKMHLISPGLEKNYLQTLEQTNFWFKPLIIIKENSTTTICNDAAQKCLNERLEASKKDRFHNAHCFIPLQLAKVLQKTPEIVADLVRFIYYRTPDEVNKSRKLPEFIPDSYLLFPVKFTRLLYAQLDSQKIQEEILKKERSKLDPDNKVPIKAFVRGFKLTLGFRILLCQSDRSDEKNYSFSTKMLNSFIFNLKKNGYFGDEIEGSDLFQQKLQRCKDYFLKTEICSKDISIRSFPRFLYEDVFKKQDSLDFKKELDIFKNKQLPPEDCDDWINFSEAEFDDFLTKKFGTNQNFGTETNEIYKNISNTLDSFMNGRQAETSLLDSEDEENTSDSESDDIEEDEATDDISDMKFDNNKKNDLKYFMTQMDNELGNRLSGSFYKIFKSKVSNETRDSDDDDSDDNENDQEKNEESWNPCLNLVKSYQGEAEISTASGPTSTLFIAMKSRIPDIKE